MVILCGFRIVVRCGNAVFVIIAHKKVSARFTGLRCLAEQGKGFLVFIFIEQIASVKILVVGVALGGVNAVQLFGFFRLRRQYAFNTVAPAVATPPSSALLYQYSHFSIFL